MTDTENGSIRITFPAISYRTLLERIEGQERAGGQIKWLCAQYWLSTYFIGTTKVNSSSIEIWKAANSRLGSRWLAAC